MLRSEPASLAEACSPHTESSSRGVSNYAAKDRSGSIISVRSRLSDAAISLREFRTPFSDLQSAFGPMPEVAVQAVLVFAPRPAPWQRARFADHSVKPAAEHRYQGVDPSCCYLCSTNPVECLFCKAPKFMDHLPPHIARPGQRSAFARRFRIRSRVANLIFKYMPTVIFCLGSYLLYRLLIFWSSRITRRVIKCQSRDFDFVIIILKPKFLQRSCE